MSVADVLAILISDIHLSLTAPIARSVEPDWLEAQLRHIDRLKEIQAEYGKAPIVVAGDIFHTADPPAELVNWAIQNMPSVYAVPGQHDLLYHNYADLKKTAYWTMVQAGKITHLEYERPQDHGRLVLWGFPWGCEISRNTKTKFFYKSKPHKIQLAVVHAYCWRPRYGYPNAPKYQLASKWQERLVGFDAAVFGDNHQGFRYGEKGIQILNCGAFIRRRASEKNQQPKYGILYDNGNIVYEDLYPDEEARDLWVDVDEAMSLVEDALELTGFVKDLKNLGEKGLDFVSSVKTFIQNNNISSGASQIIMEALDDGRR